MALTQLSKNDFRLYLSCYNQYVRERYSRYEDVRFIDIPKRLGDSSPPPHLTHKEVLNLDNWIRKRGTPLHRKVHETRTKEIEKNDHGQIKNVTKRAYEIFNGYKENQEEVYEKGAREAMEELKKLQGIDGPRACLILSVLFPETVPFCSEALYRQMQITQGGNEVESDQYQDFTAIFKKTKELIQRLNGTAEGKEIEVTAVEVEKVAFVLQRNAEIEDMKKNWITNPRRMDAAKELGKGNYGEVFKVKTNANMEVDEGVNHIAIKMILASDNIRESRHRILSEITISSRLADLSKERFVALLGWNEDPVDNCYYIAMENIEYGDLEKNLKNAKDGTWTEAKVKTVAEQILDGLIYMHTALIAHRDLKPQNILLASTEVIHIKIADFGVSKSLSKRETTNFVTNNGTHGYKAPEVSIIMKMDGDERLDPYSYNADIWSLGCIIYRMARGAKLFPNDSTASNEEAFNRYRGLIKEELTDEKIKVRMSASGIDFVKKLIVFNPQKRPNATQAMNELQKWKIGEEGVQPQRIIFEKSARKLSEKVMRIKDGIRNRHKK